MASYRVNSVIDLVYTRLKTLKMSVQSFTNPPGSRIGADGRPKAYSEVPSQYTEEVVEKWRGRDDKLKRSIRGLRLFTRLSSTLLSIVTTALLAATLHKYLSTRGTIIDGRNAWAKDTKLWPTTMLLAVSSISTIINLCMLGAYMVSIKAANQTATVSTVYSMVVLFAHVIVWAAATSLYRYGKDTNGISNDLWGWTCSKKAQKIQGAFEHVVHFNTFCNIQSGSWYTSMVNTGTQIFVVLTIIFVAVRIQHKRKLNQLAEHQNAIPAGAV